ncbi:MAG: CocE/NonD family hydrolase [Acidobacteriota bacterium]
MLTSVWKLAPLVAVAGWWIGAGAGAGPLAPPATGAGARMGAGAGAAARAVSQTAAPVYDKTEAEIAMRDGVRLHTEIHVPKGTGEALPFLMVRTPYGASGQSRGLAAGRYSELEADGYIFVFQDIRGRHASEGKFVMMRPPRDSSDARAVDESTDAYDTIEWLLKNVPHNNGRVGVFGISYPGWLTVMAAIDPHPALKAVSEQASPADMFLGDDFYHNGAFRLSYGFEYSSEMESSKTNNLFQFDRYDTYEWYLNLLPLSEASTRWAHGNLPTWNAFEQHPNYDAFWRSIAVPSYVGTPRVPNLNVAGWWDQEDFYGPVKIYETLERGDRGHQNYIVAGPWNHGGWSGGDGRTLGPVDFGSDTSKYYRENIEAPWFAYWLKGRGEGKFPEARTFETGSNRWRSFDAWPPRKGVTERKLYAAGSRRLSFDVPRDEEAFDSYISDPANPVPYRNRPVSPTYGRPGWSTWLLEDQRFAHRRPDVLSWETETLPSNVTVAGDIVAHLFASTTGSDADWVVKLIDVYPEEYAQDPKMGGYQLMIASEIFRARFRKSFERAEPVQAGAVEEYAIDLHTNNHAFLKGHRIMVQVQSTWFPAYSRNPQKFVPNIFTAEPADYQAATQRIYRSSRYPTHVVLPVVAR